MILDGEMLAINEIFECELEIMAIDANSKILADR